MNREDDAFLRYEDLDAMEAPSWESFYQGVGSALILIGIGAAAAT
ncbi:MpaA1 family daptide-type RiPP [Microbacterium sp. LS_15]